MPGKPRLRNHIFSETEKQIFYGSILGDGCLFQQTQTKNYSYSEKHSLKQEAYLRWKVGHLNALKPRVHYIRDKSAFVEEMIQLQTSSSEFFTELREELYPKNIKIVSRSLLDRLQPLGLAIWIMDDGTLYKESYHKKNSTYI